MDNLRFEFKRKLWNVVRSEVVNLVMEEVVDEIRDEVWDEVLRELGRGNGK